MIHRITIPAWRPTPLNKLMRSHWRTPQRLKKIDREMIAAYARRAAIVPLATGKRRVSLEITLTGRQKETDPDAYQKSTLDALVKCQLLVDDSEKFVEWAGVTYSRGKVGQTVIVLQDVDDVLGKNLAIFDSLAKALGVKYKIVQDGK